MALSRADCAALDAADPLAGLRAQFALPPGVVYLDGNSLGPTPVTVAERVQRAIADEWGRDLIAGWNTHDWLHLPQRVGDAIAPLIGAGAGEVLVCDSTSVNLYKVLTAAVTIAMEHDPSRMSIMSERTNFPTDLYIAEGVARSTGARLDLVDPVDLEGADVAPLIGPQAAVVVLTHVDYRTGRLLDMRRITTQVHAAGALMVWDLAHSAGALPVDLSGSDADFAVGCGYKYLNGGPGAPAFVWMHPRHASHARQPLQGWLGHAAPFEFTADYRAAPGIAGFAAGTPPILSLTALACGVDTVRAADAHGGVEALRAKSVALTTAFIDLVDARCASADLHVVTPRDPACRGSQVALRHDGDAYAVVQALIARGVIGDFRAPDIARFGFAPLYTRFVDVWAAVDHLSAVIASGEWREPGFATRAAVT
ncbi:MAG: Kynureninase [Ilumatobacteraceae bacterium]|nr:Kynureninase [Ilumatobacteraceae bacterium]